MKNLFLCLCLGLGLSSCDSLHNKVNGCVANYVAPDLTQLKSDLNTAKARWQAANLNSYSYNYTQYGWGGPYHVTVQNDSVISVTSVADGHSVSDLTLFKTIPELFAEIDYALNHTGKCTALKFTFDQQKGYPTSGNSSEAAEPIMVGAFTFWTVEHLTTP